jgi:ferredoxin
MDHLPESRIYITVNKERCCGAGHCVLIAPKVFGQDDSDGTAILIDEAPPSDLHQSVLEAAKVCPTRAIAVTGTLPAAIARRLRGEA